jgi:hypothetical protein
MTVLNKQEVVPLYTFLQVNPHQGVRLFCECHNVSPVQQLKQKRVRLILSHLDPRLDRGTGKPDPMEPTMIHDCLPLMTSLFPQIPITMEGLIDSAQVSGRCSPPSVEVTTPLASISF